MKKYCSFLLLAFTLGLTTACDEEPTAAERRASQVMQAFNVVEFLEQEVQSLSSQKVAVQKYVSKGSEAIETKAFQNLNWVEELAPFADADLNKPALIGLFTEEQTLDEAGQTVRRFVAKEAADTNVQEAVYTFNAQGQLVQLDATIRQENMLFETLKQLHLKVDPSATPRLQRYRLDETQKLLFMGAEQYGVEGKVLQ